MHALRTRRGSKDVDPAEHRAALRRLRSHLDSERVVVVSVEVAAEVIRRGKASIWLTTGRDRPRLAASSGGAGTPDEVVPDDVLRCSRNGRRTGRAALGRLCLPVEAPGVGLVAVLCVEAERPITDAEQAFLSEVAGEAGVALGTSNLYEQALAMRDKSEAILGRVADAIVVTDPRGAITDWNPAAHQVIGRSAAEAVGGTCHAVLGLRLGEKELDCAAGCALLAARADSILGVEAWRYGEEARRQPLLASVAAVTDQEGNVAQIVHSLRDITRLKEADEAKTMFLATASHELKTPLTVIKGFAEVLLRSADWDETQRTEALEAIARRATDLSRIVNRLMLSSRIEAGRVEVELREVDLRPILEERTRAFRAATGREVAFDAPAFLPPVRADADAVTTILDHLLDNAVKYSPGGEPVTVTAVVEDGRVRMGIADQGIGMHAEQAARCFDKFWQAESGDTRRFGGTGIGLYIVRSLAEAMGAEVGVSSAPGAGSTFTLAIACAGTVPRPAAPAPAAANTTGEPSVIREFMRQIGIPERRGR